ncbi:hypothetical protein DTO164E3_427 [Paecilomyces variotii]|nr:hypothetical protein DTO164E3_427 [Paecilomyces variotii]
MTRRSAAFLKDAVVAVTGTFPGYKQSDLKTIVEEYGGTFVYKVIPECTHFIATQKEFDVKGSKVIQAMKVYTCDIVTLDWLLESVEAKKQLPGKDYLFETKKKNDTKDDDASADDTKDSKKSKKSKEDDKPPKKRPLEEALKEEDDGHLDKKQKDGQLAKSKDLKVDVDDGCYLRTNHRVYISDDGMIWDATLNQTNAAANNNKFYRIQLLESHTGNSYKTWTRWGRVGEIGQSAILGQNLESAMAEFKKKFKDKSGLTWENRLDPPKKGKYTFIERNYEEDSDNDEDETNGKKKSTEEKKESKAVESTLSVPIQNLMNFIFNQGHFLSAMAQMSYDARKLPLGKLSKRTLRAGFQILKDLSDLFADHSLAMSKYGVSYRDATEDLSNRYFTTIPHVFGRNRPPVIDNEAMIKREVVLLEALTDMEISNEIMKDSSKDEEEINRLDRMFQGLGMEEMTPLDHSSSEFKEIKDYLLGTHGSTHHLRYQVLDIFRIERQGENDRFNKSPYANLPNSNRRLLWHGSRSTNFGGILSQGLRIAPPEAPVSGYMFGKGVYFADMSSKSANYCWSSSSANMGLLLLCDVELGDPMLELTSANFNAGNDAKAGGMLSTLGKGMTVPQGWKDAGCVHPSLKGVKMPDTSAPLGSSGGFHGLMYNEYIVYDVAQIRQKYLLHVRM